MEPRALDPLGKRYTTELRGSPGAHTVAQTGLKLTERLLPQLAGARIIGPYHRAYFLHYR